MIGGWGFLLGDQGSGARIGRALYEAALLAHDGIVAATPLLGAVLAEAGRAGGDGRLRPARHARRFRAAMVPRVLDGGGGGRRRPAAAILAEAEAAVARAIDRLQADGPLPVCFLGGLGPVYAARLAARYRGLIRAAARHRARRRAGAGAGASDDARSSRPRELRRRGGGPLYLQLNRRDRRRRSRPAS